MKKTRKKQNRKKQNQVSFPSLGNIFHHLAKAFGVEAKIKEQANKALDITDRTIERFWTGATQEDDQHTDQIHKIHIRVLFKDVTGFDKEPSDTIFMQVKTVCDRYELMTRKVSTYSSNEITVLWSLSSRFFVPFLSHFLLEIIPGDKILIPIVNLLSVEKPIGYNFNKFVEWAGFQDRKEIWNRLREEESYRNKDKAEALRRSLERLEKGERFSKDYNLEHILTEITKVSGKSDNKMTTMWLKSFQLASAITYFINISDRVFGEEVSKQLQDFFKGFFEFFQYQERETDKWIQFAPYWKGLEVDSRGNSPMHNMMDWDQYHYKTSNNPWKLPEENYEWILWEEDQQPFSRMFLRFYEDNFPDSTIRRDLLEQSDVEISSDYLSLIQKAKDGPSFKNYFGLALYAEYLNEIDKTFEFLKEAFPLASSNIEKFHTLLYQLHCHCDLEREKKEEEEKQAEVLLAQIKQFQQIDPEFFQQQDRIEFYEARWYLLKNRPQKAAKLYDQAYKTAKNRGGLIVQYILKEGALAAAKADKHTKNSLKNLYRGGYWKVLYTHPWNEVEDYIKEHLRKQFYKEIPKIGFYPSVSKKQVEQDATNMSGIILTDKENFSSWLDPENPNRIITDCGPSPTYPIIIAATYGKYEEAKRLIEAGADVNVYNSNNETALLFALFLDMQMGFPMGNDKRKKTGGMIANLLLDSGISADNINLRSKRKKQSALFAAIEGGYTEIVKKLIEKGADLNQRGTPDDSTPLYQTLAYIARSKKTEDDYGNTLRPEIIQQENFARSWADIFPQPVFKENLNSIEQLRQKFTQDPDFQKFMNKISNIMISGYQKNLAAYYEIAGLLIKAGVKLDERHLENHTVLTYAAELKEYEIVKLLLEHDADVTVVTNGNINTLHHAIELRHTHTELLYNPPPFGIDLENPKEHSDLVQLLLDAGCDSNLEESTHLTPLELAWLSSQTNTARLIESYNQEKTKTPEELFVEAIKYEEKGEKWIPKAVATYLSAIDKSHVPSLLKVADLYAKIHGCQEKSEKYYLRYIQEEQENEKKGIGHAGLGTFYCKKRKYKEAEVQFLEGVKCGLIGECYLHLGNLTLYTLKQPNRAIHYYEKALNAEEWKVMSNLGILYLEEQKNFDKAERIWLEAVDKGVTAAMIHLGKFYEFYVRDLQKAEKYYLQAKSHQHSEANERLRTLKLKMRS